ncbi:MAG: primosomal protein N' [Desulfobulbaceae bacterium]|nr:primosomal protein N' [Desulfobulbaceae bacterium]
MPDSDHYLEVAVAAPIPQSLTYLVPPGEPPPKTGCRVLVPLGRRQVTGYVLGPAAPPPPGLRIKKYSELLDREPLFPAAMVGFFRWLADYYQYPLGEVIKTALPAGTTTASTRRLLLKATGAAELASLAGSPEAPPWLAELLARGEIPPGATRKLFRDRAARRRLEPWLAAGWLELREELAGDQVRARQVTCATLTPAGLSAPPPELKKAELKTLTLLRELAGGQRVPIPRPHLAKGYAGARAALVSLAARGLLTVSELPLYRDPFGEPPLVFPAPEQLTEEQVAVLAEIDRALTAGTFAPMLLHGVTGCGKTEVYLRAARRCLALGRPVLVLVPEIALTTQLEGHFLTRFGREVALLHSGLSPGERFDQWQRIVRGEAKIVIGARSAVFAPLAAPGLIIVDEEHDPSYKQEDNLRYQARDLAVLRASLAAGVVLLGSATPSLTSYHHAIHGKYRLLSMRRRVADQEMPRVEVIDLRRVKTVSGRPPLFAPELTIALKETLAAGDQSLVFLNRRGYASLLLCRACGQAVRCPSCAISLTLHQGRGELVCHYCGHTITSRTVCSQCRSPELVPVGFGTERLEAELKGLLPTARIARLDRDTSSNRQDFLALLRAVHQREVDILVGTQMITKGHHFPHVTLVGVVWADASLNFPDFRAGERTYQLLSQVTGRAGRGDKAGRVIIQALAPDHYAISTARQHDYQAFYREELALRRGLLFPPFSHLVNLRFDGVEEHLVRRLAEQTAEQARRLGRQARVTILGPAPAPLSRLQGRYRWQLLLKGENRASLHALCRQLSGERETGPVKLTVDVDPENML